MQRCCIQLNRLSGVLRRRLYAKDTILLASGRVTAVCHRRSLSSSGHRPAWMQPSLESKFLADMSQQGSLLAADFEPMVGAVGRDRNRHPQQTLHAGVQAAEDLYAIVDILLADPAAIRGKEATEAIRRAGAIVATQLRAAALAAGTKSQVDKLVSEARDSIELIVRIVEPPLMDALDDSWDVSGPWQANDAPANRGAVPIDTTEQAEMAKDVLLSLRVLDVQGGSPLQQVCMDAVKRNGHELNQEDSLRLARAGAAHLLRAAAGLSAAKSDGSACLESDDDAVLYSALEHVNSCVEMVSDHLQRAADSGVDCSPALLASGAEMCTSVAVALSGCIELVPEAFSRPVAASALRSLVEAVERTKAGLDAMGSALAADCSHLSPRDASDWIVDLSSASFYSGCWPTLGYRSREQYAVAWPDQLGGPQTAPSEVHVMDGQADGSTDLEMGPAYHPTTPDLETLGVFPGSDGVPLSLCSSMHASSGPESMHRKIQALCSVAFDAKMGVWQLALQLLSASNASLHTARDANSLAYGYSGSMPGTLPLSAALATWSQDCQHWETYWKACIRSVDGNQDASAAPESASSSAKRMHGEFYSCTLSLVSTDVEEARTYLRRVARRRDPAPLLSSLWNQTALGRGEHRYANLQVGMAAMRTLCSRVGRDSLTSADLSAGSEMARLLSLAQASASPQEVLSARDDSSVAPHDAVSETLAMWAQLSVDAASHSKVPSWVDLSAAARSVTAFAAVERQLKSSSQNREHLAGELTRSLVGAAVHQLKPGSKSNTDSHKVSPAVARTCAHLLNLRGLCHTGRSSSSSSSVDWTVVEDLAKPSIRFLNRRYERLEWTSMFSESFEEALSDLWISSSDAERSTRRLHVLASRAASMLPVAGFEVSGSEHFDAADEASMGSYEVLSQPGFGPDGLRPAAYFPKLACASSAALGCIAAASSQRFAAYHSGLSSEEPGEYIGYRLQGGRVPTVAEGYRLIVPQAATTATSGLPATGARMLHTSSTALGSNSVDGTDWGGGSDDGADTPAVSAEAVLEKYEAMLSDARSPMTSRQLADAALGLFVMLETGSDSLGEDARPRAGDICVLLAELLRRLAGSVEAVADFDYVLHKDLVVPRRADPRETKRNDRKRLRSTPMHLLPTGTLFVLSRAMAAYHASDKAWARNKYAEYVPSQPKTAGFQLEYEADAMQGEPIPPAVRRMRHMLLPGLERSPGPQAALAFRGAISALADALASRMPKDTDSEDTRAGELAELYASGLVYAYENLGAVEPDPEYCRQARELALQSRPSDAAPPIEGMDEGDALAVAVMISGARIESRSAQLLMACVADQMVDVLPVLDGLGLIELGHAFANYTAGIPRPKSSIRGEDLDQAKDTGLLPRVSRPKELRSDASRLKRVAQLSRYRTAEAMSMLDLELASRVPLVRSYAQLTVMLNPFVRARMYAPKLTHAAVLWLDYLRDRDSYRSKLAMGELMPLLESLGVRGLKKRWM